MGRAVAFEKPRGMKVQTVIETEDLRGHTVGHGKPLPGQRMRCGGYGEPAGKVGMTRHLANRTWDQALRDTLVWLLRIPHAMWCPT